SIDYSAFDGGKFLCSGSEDKTVRVWDLDTNKQRQLFSGHLRSVNCVKFSPYYYHNHNRTVICSSSNDQTIRFWDIDNNNKPFKTLGQHDDGVCGIEFSSFSSGRYLCSGSGDSTVRLWDVETSKSLHVFSEHTNWVWCVDFSPLQSNNNDKSNNIGVIGGNGYTFCSGSNDHTIRVWDIEKTKQSIVFRGHRNHVNSVKYQPYQSGISGGANTILSGSADRHVCLWDARSGQLIQIAVEYPQF
ncbi:WD-40 repeat-containing protein, partial [Reticulomyxa filosa]